MINYVTIIHVKIQHHCKNEKLFNENIRIIKILIFFNNIINYNIVHFILECKIS
jgi:hypothetical protein